MERGYTMFAMIAGASFYGYMIGNITSIVAEGDAHTKAYYEKMKKISAWCDHQEFPRLLRRRVRRYFKSYFSDKSALDEKGIMTELSQDLRADITEYLLHPLVRNHPMFRGMPMPVLAKLVHILERTTYKGGHMVVQLDQHGTAMFIIISGEAVISSENVHRPLMSGESFGEGIILGLTKQSTCTVRTESDCIFYELPYQEFRMTFQATPDVVDTMREQLRAQVKANPRSSILSQRGLSQLLTESIVSSGIEPVSQEPPKSPPSKKLNPLAAVTRLKKQSSIRL
jgi:voltage-gated potassium channel